MSDVFGTGSPAVLTEVNGDVVDCDIAIFGSGMGGSTLAWALRESGARVLVVERGDFLPREEQNWSPGPYDDNLIEELRATLSADVPTVTSL